MSVSIYDLQAGDQIFAATTIQNDGGVPGIPTDAIMAQPGTRGVLLNTGHLEHDPDTVLFLVRFEDENGELGMPVGCQPEELSAVPTSM